MSQGEFFIDNAEGHKINPATQEDAALLLNEAVQSKDKNSLDFGTQSITLVGAAVTAGDNPCRTCLVTHSDSGVYVGNIADGSADTSSFLIPPDIVVEIPVRNTNKLSFFASSATVFILWRD